MPTPSTRTAVRIARGTYSNLNSSIADLEEGEICYATDEDKLYVVESSTLVEQPGLGTAQTFTAAQRGSSVTLTSGATITPDFAAGNNFDLSLGINATLANPTNLTAGQSGVIVITNGAYTLAYGSYWKFAGGTAPTITTSAVSVIAYYVESATRITAQAILNVS